MGLHLADTLENVIELLAYNKEIMDIMKLPTLSKTDSEVIRNQKLNQAIKQCITKSAQNPQALGEKFEPVIIDGVTYADFGEIRIAVSTTQGITTLNPEFGRQKLDINIFYNNTTDTDKALKILDLISDLLSNIELKILWEDKEGKTCWLKRFLEDGIILTQTAVINNYEKVGIRYMFYNSYYNF